MMLEQNQENQISRGDTKKLRALEAVRRKNFKKALLVGSVVLVIALLVFGLVWWNKWTSKNLPGMVITDQGREHVGPEHKHTYNSNPPTSGPHFSSPAEWGVYKEELADEILIHNLEHGGIWISYKPDVPDDVRVKLENFYEKWGRKIIVTPRVKNDTDVALVAWGHLDKFGVSEYSDERVDRFIKAFRNKGPEFVP